MPFKVLPTTLADIPTLVSIYLAAFRTNGFGAAAFSDTPAVRAWWRDVLSDELSNQKGAAMYNLVEYGTASPSGEQQDGPTSVAFAKWIRPLEGGVEPEVEELEGLPEGCDAELVRRYLPELGRRHRKCMGARAHGYLELLATHPTHQRRGAATTLINHVLVDNPRNYVYDVYLESSPEGLSTYRRLGFERRDSFMMDIGGRGYETVMMVRPGKGGLVDEGV